MDATVRTYSYKAFVSYAHADRRGRETWGLWLHRTLEAFRVPKDLVGTTGENGVPVPTRLYPLFLDRAEFPADDRLGEKIEEALDASEQLIVVCSPAAARSTWVNNEIVHFKRLQRGRRILAIIVDGEPNAADPAHNCFPPALTRSFGEDFETSGEPVEVLAADAREAGDGERDAVLKIVAGVLGVGLNDLKRRKEAAERRSNLIFRGVATSLVALFASLAAVAGWFYAEAEAQRQRAEAALEASSQTASGVLETLALRYRGQFGVATRVILSLLKAAEQLSRTTADHGGEPANLRLIRARALTEMAETMAILGDYAGADATISSALDLAAQSQFRRGATGPLELGATIVTGNALRVGADIDLSRRKTEAAIQKFKSSIDNFLSALPVDVENGNAALTPLSPEEKQAVIGLTKTMNRLSDVLFATGKAVGARLFSERSASLANRLHVAFPEEEAVLVQLSRSEARRISLDRSIDATHKLRLYNALLETIQAARVSVAESSTLVREATFLLERIVDLQIGMFDWVAAQNSLDWKQRLEGELTALDPGNLNNSASEARTVERKALLQEQMGNATEATAQFHKSLSLWRRVNLLAPDSDEFMFGMTFSMVAIYRLEPSSDAASLLVEACQIRMRLSLSHPSNLGYLIAWAECATLLRRSGRLDDVTLEAIRAALDAALAGSESNDSRGVLLELRRELDESVR